MILKRKLTHITTVIMCLFFITFTANTRELPEPYNSIQLLPFDPQGWYHNARAFEEIFSQNRTIKTVIEIGSWIGASTRHLANLLPEDGKLYAVDHWRGSVEHQPGGPSWTPAYNHLFQQFLSNVIHAGLTHKIIPIRMTSDEAARALKIRPDLIYIDGEHDTASVYADICRWYPFIKGHGILCGDDWTWPSVAAAVERFAKENQLSIVAQGNLWRLTDKR